MTDAVRGIALGVATSAVVWVALIAALGFQTVVVLGAVAGVGVATAGIVVGLVRWWSECQAARALTADAMEVEG